MTMSEGIASNNHAGAAGENLEHLHIGQPVHRHRAGLVDWDPSDGGPAPGGARERFESRYKIDPPSAVGYKKLTRYIPLWRTRWPITTR